MPSTLPSLLATGRTPTAQVQPVESGKPSTLGPTLQVSAPQRIDSGDTSQAVETAIAVGAGSPPHLVAGWNDLREHGSGNFWSLGVGVSLDGGVTWTDFLMELAGNNVDLHEGDPMVLFEPLSGYLFVGGIRFSGHRVLFISRKAAAATTFEPPVIINSGGFIDRAWLATGRDPGNPHTTLIHVAYNLGVQTSDDFGATWGPVRSLELGLAQHPRVDRAGRLFLIDWDFDDGVRLQRSFDGGDTFLAPIEAATRMDTWDTQDGSRFPGQFRVGPLALLAMHPVSGTLYALYFDTTGIVGGNADVDLYLTESSDLGVTWSTPMTVPSNLPGDQLFPWLEVDAAGRLHLMYFDGGSFTQNDDVENGRFHVYYALSLDGGSTWTTVQLTNTPIESALSDWGSTMGQFLGDFVNLTVDGDRVYAVYPSTMNGDQDIVLQTIDIDSEGPIFIDGFEIGDTGRWSAAVPNDQASAATIRSRSASGRDDAGPSPPGPTATPPTDRRNRLSE
ncbi:MAG: sialidase family protein [Acidobacteriota bacterium]